MIKILSILHSLNFNLKQTLVLLFSLMIGVNSLAISQVKDDIAEKIVLYQRDNGGWPQYSGDPTDYKKPLSKEFKSKLIGDKLEKDATIDDKSTTFEIVYLLQQAAKTKNEVYLDAAEKGMQYLFEAQNSAGGWPQKYPDISGYHKHITYNDQAMISVLWIMKRISDKEEPYTLLSQKTKERAKKSLEKGIECILNTQYIQNGKLTAWCAQHDSETLLPASARAFEPASLSGNESVGILKFLMAIENPDQRIQNSINAGIAWFKSVEIKDKAVRYFKNVNAPKGRDIEVIDEEGKSLWARFYDLETNEPIFMGRDKERKANLSDLEIERRTGYAYLGTWPKKLVLEQ
ncbi:pectate lyase [uncultured Arcticibacterium sp.]|uniref:pectate lyase n=1 Tax=uncultured Arcticibacterium sp. TaxID=2173042 RepID=UPI0030F9353F